MTEQPAQLQTRQREIGLLSIAEASAWATQHVGRNVTASNISYLIQYGRIRKIDNSGVVSVAVQDLEAYYDSYEGTREMRYKDKLGSDINWALSFSQIKEAESTKHVHRLHPYKGKFIPQLVEYFIDDHIDNFKHDVYFKPGDILLDPFSGSGTTMVQSSECGINAIGIDVSAFNALIANCKVAKYNISYVESEITRINNALRDFVSGTRIAEAEEKLLKELSSFNNEFFPVPEFKYQLRQGVINEHEYGSKKEQEFLPRYYELVQEYNIKLRQDRESNFLEKWFSQHVRDEIDFVFERINEVTDSQTKKILTIILSRTMRSCRATTHSDLATLVDPVTTTYYCTKHGKICKPLFSIAKWWYSYCKDTITRLCAFNSLRSPTEQFCLTGDSKKIDVIAELRHEHPQLADMVTKRRINGIFSSPPYVGMIDYHEQHAYAYDLFGFPRYDESEIGRLLKGKGKEAQRSYTEGISQVLLNCKPLLAVDYNVFLVANDKHNLYPTIAENAGMIIVNTFRRPVLNRSEKDKTAYSETIFHMKERK